MKADHLMTMMTTNTCVLMMGCDASHLAVHRDLKPENLLERNRGDDFHVMLADFGLACVVGKWATIVTTTIAPSLTSGASM